MPKVRDLTPQAPWQQIESTAKDWDQLGAAALLRMLNHLHLVRAFEEMVLELDGQGLIHGPAHSSIGQDGSAVGAISTLRSSDQVTGSHRGHHQFLAKCLQHVDPADSDPRTSPLPQAVRRRSRSQPNGRPTWW